MKIIISWFLLGGWIIATCNGSALKKLVKPDRFKIEHNPSSQEYTLPSSPHPTREFHSSWDNEEPSISRTAGLAPSYPSLISVIFNRWSQASNKNAIEDNSEYEDEDEEVLGRSKRSVEPSSSKKKPRCLASLFGFGADSILESPPPLPDFSNIGVPSPFGGGGNLQGGILSPGLESSKGYPSQFTPGYNAPGFGSGLGIPSQYNSPGFGSGFGSSGSGLGVPSQYNSPGFGSGFGSSGSGLGVPSQYTPGLGLASDALKNSQGMESQLYGSQYDINSQLGGIPNSGIPFSSGYRALEPALGMFKSFMQILGSTAGRALRDYSYSYGGNFQNFQLRDLLRPPSINSLPPPPSIDFLPPPRAIKSLPPPRSIGSLPSPPSTDYLPPPP